MPALRRLGHWGPVVRLAVCFGRRTRIGKSRHESRVREEAVGRTGTELGLHGC